MSEQSDLAALLDELLRRVVNRTIDRDEAIALRDEFAARGVHVGRSAALPFHEMVREARRNERMTLRALADAVDADFTYLSKIENGRDRPSRDLAVRLDTALVTDGSILSAFDALGCPRCGAALAAIEAAPTPVARSTTAHITGTASWGDGWVGVVTRLPRGTRICVTGPLGRWCGRSVGYGPAVWTGRIADLSRSVFAAICGDPSIGLCRVTVRQ